MCTVEFYRGKKPRDHLVQSLNVREKTDAQRVGNLPRVSWCIRAGLELEFSPGCEFLSQPTNIYLACIMVPVLGCERGPGCATLGGDREA